MQKRRPALYLGVLLALILSATCASPPENLVILVSVKGLTADVVALSVDLALNGTKMQHTDVKSNLSAFALTLPNRDDQRGLLEISATAASTALCRVSSGRTTLSIDAGTFYMVELSLSAQPTPLCALTLDVTGPGTVNVMAGSATRICSGHCVFDYPVGTNVILSAMTTSVSVPLKWSGDCGGPATTPCSLVTQKPNTVAVTFGPAPVPAPSCFGAAANFPVGVGPYSIAIGDFNGDTKLDLASANWGSNNVSVLLGNGMGDFAASSGSPFSVGSAPEFVAAGDFNGDTKLDLAVANTGAGNVSVMLGNGMGGFAPSSGSPISVGSGPISIAIVDFNADTKLDLAVANFYSANVSVLLGNGMGGFSPSPASPFSVGMNPYGVAAGKFNSDNHLDLVVANYGNNNLSVLLGNGIGGFAPSSNSPFSVGTNPYFVAVGDFNNDTNLDVATANHGSNNMSVLLGNGMGGLAPSTSSPYSVGTTPASVAVGDFNGDTKLDVAIANYGSTSVSVLLGNGMGGFAPSSGSPFSVGSGAWYVALGDFNGDTKLDLAVADYVSNSVRILLNQSTASVACQ